jgi:hypothetical protein
MASASEWADRVSEWKASGEGAKEFCAGRGYSANTLLWWSSQLRRGRALKATKAPSVQMARVVRAPSVATPPGVVLVELGGARVAVSSGASPDTLRAVFDALRPRSAP